MSPVLTSCGHGARHNIHNNGHNNDGLTIAGEVGFILNQHHSYETNKYFFQKSSFYVSHIADSNLEHKNLKMN